MKFTTVRGIMMLDIRANSARVKCQTSPYDTVEQSAKPFTLAMSSAKIWYSTIKYF